MSGSYPERYYFFEIGAFFPHLTPSLFLPDAQVLLAVGRNLFVRGEFAVVTTSA